MQRSIQLLKIIVVALVFSGLIFTGIKMKKKIDSKLVSVGVDDYSRINTANTRTSKDSKISTNDLQAKDGKNGNDCWVVYSGNVYSANYKEQWENGQYISSREELKCGQDLTNTLDKSPFKSEILSTITKVGTF